MKRTALITGASAGIGRDYARLLACEGYDLVITARREDRLKELAREIEDTHNVRVTIIPADLHAPEAPQKIAATLTRKKINIDYLVNNAGYSVPGRFRDVRWEVERDMIQSMLTALAELCHIFAPAMAARGFGRIVNVASVAAYLPGTDGGTLYSPIKAFVQRFSQSLAIEYRDMGVHVIALCPGFTWSEFHDVAGNRAAMNKLPAFMWLTGTDVVLQGHKAVELNKGPVVINGGIYRFLAKLMQILPENIMTRYFARRANKTAARNVQARAEDRIDYQPPQSKKPTQARKKAAPKKKTASRKKPAAKK